MSPVAARPAPAPAAAAEPDEAEMQRLFKVTMGTSFDPKSRMDRGKMEQMKQFFAEQGGLKGRTANRFALDYYKTL
jgi:hypothetical protein